MLQDWALAQKGQGITVQSVRGDVIVLEFNEFLGRIASGRISPDDIATSQVMTDGLPRRVGDLKLYAQVTSGQVQTAELPRREPGGVLAFSPSVSDPLQPLQSELYSASVQATTQPPVALLNIGMILAWALALLGFSLLCSMRPGTTGTHPPTQVQYRPVTHPEHPPWLPH